MHIENGFLYWTNPFPLHSTRHFHNKIWVVASASTVHQFIRGLTQTEARQFTEDSKQLPICAHRSKKGQRKENIYTLTTDALSWEGLQKDLHYIIGNTYDLYQVNIPTWQK